jgi:hypothetical protein
LRVLLASAQRLNILIAMSTSEKFGIKTGTISGHILTLRGQRVLLDADLAQLYGVATKALVQAVKRNLERFPGDFMFQLDSTEWATLRSQIVTSNAGHGGRRYAPFAFTEQGVAMLSSVLSSPQAIAVNIEIMRAFVHLREIVSSNHELSLRLEKLESKAELLYSKQGNFEQTTREQLRQVFEVIRELMSEPDPPKKRSIGFVTPDDSVKQQNLTETEE